MPARRSIPFLIVVGLFGLGLGFTINVLDPFIYTEKTRLLAPPALKNTVLGFITIMALLVALLIQPLIGRWSDHTHNRWGRRAPYLSGGTIGLGLALFLIVTADTLWLLVIAAMLASASSNTTQSAWQALIPDRVPKSQHGTAAGLKTLLELIGAVAGVAVAGVTLTQGNLWGAPLAAIGLFVAILLITLHTLWRTGERRSTPSLIRHSPIRHPLIPYSLIRRMPAAFPWWMLNRFLFWSAAISIRTFMLNYMEDVLSLSLAEAEALSSRLFIVLGIGVFLLALPAGAVADRLGRRPLLIVAGLLAAAGVGLIVLLRDLNLLYLAGGLIAGGAGIFASASWALATDLAAEGEGALYLALANAATVLGSIGGRLGGPLIDGLNHLTGTVTVGYLVVFGIAALFFAASSGVVLKISEKPGRRGA